MKYFLFLISTFMFSQTEDKLKVNSLSFGFGIYNQQHFTSKGITGNIDFSISYNRNLLIMYVAGGFGGNDRRGNIFALGTDAVSSYKEIDLLYGREFKITDWFSIEGQFGIGTFTQDISIIEENRSSVCFPIRLKLLLYATKKFALGLNSNYNINTINNINSNDLIFHFKF